MAGRPGVDPSVKLPNTLLQQTVALLSFDRPEIGVSDMMTARAVLVVFVLSVSLVRAAIPPLPDALSTAYEAALVDLRAGMDRQTIADRLQPLVDKHPKSFSAEVARAFLLDLTASAKNPPAKQGEPPEKRLAEVRIPYNILEYDANWDKPLKNYVAENPNDPAVELVAAERSVITRLIPLLSDRSPARCPRTNFMGELSVQPRVCNLALKPIEYHSQCRFAQTKYLHALPQAERELVAQRL
ncbi:MAG: hypothetical protein JWM11_5230 [Planctomycetaceae bacterium]|nr:hypothetical protein [Planctomycetaceae bacterium]